MDDPKSQTPESANIPPSASSRGKMLRWLRRIVLASVIAFVIFIGLTYLASELTRKATEESLCLEVLYCDEKFLDELFVPSIEMKLRLSYSPDRVAWPLRLFSRNEIKLDSQRYQHGLDTLSLIDERGFAFKLEQLSCEAVSTMDVLNKWKRISWTIRFAAPRRVDDVRFCRESWRLQMRHFQYIEFRHAGNSYVRHLNNYSRVMISQDLIYQGTINIGLDEPLVSAPFRINRLPTFDGMLASEEIGSRSEDVFVPGTETDLLRDRLPGRKF